MRKSWFLPMVLTALAVAGFAPGMASASSLTIELGTPNTAIAAYPGPYGNLNINLTDSTHATITLTAESHGGYNYTFGDTGSLGLNTNGAVSVVGGTGGITMTQPSAAPFTGAGPVLNIDTGGQQVDGFGNFNFVVKLKDGANSSVNTMSFQLQNTSGTWSSSADVLSPNSTGFSVAGHVYVWNSDYSLNPATGYAANPEPSSMAIAGMFGVFFVGYVKFRQRRAIA